MRRGSGGEEGTLLHSFLNLSCFWKIKRPLTELNSSINTLFLQHFTVYKRLFLKPLHHRFCWYQAYLYQPLILACRMCSKHFLLIRNASSVAAAKTHPYLMRTSYPGWRCIDRKCKLGSNSKHLWGSGRTILGDIRFFFHLFPLLYFESKIFHCMKLLQIDYKVPVKCFQNPLQGVYRMNSYVSQQSFNNSGLRNRLWARRQEKTCPEFPDGN